MGSTPLVATLLGVFVLGEHLGPAGWAGAALVAVGLGLQGLRPLGPVASLDSGHVRPR
jgi:drug/metabolite transporter (DMT)-like permease